MKGHILEELRQHIPYTIFSVAAGIMALGVLSVLIEESIFPQKSERLFHIFHPLHLFFSASATTSMFCRHNERIIKAILVGIVGSVGICGISDIFLPYLAGELLGVKMHLHICIIIHQELILSFVLFGIICGFLLPPAVKSTVFSHSAHILVSSMASILYLVSFGLVDWIDKGGMVFIYIVLAVVIPCCISDIVFPLLMTKKGRHLH